MHELVARKEDWGPPLAMPLVRDASIDGLTWWPQDGVGYYPVEAGIAPYDQMYFDRFDRDAKTDLGRALMQARVDFVEQYYQGSLLIDVGIGSGAFVELRQRTRRTYGYDVNPAGIRWLKERNLFCKPYGKPFHAMTMWDVLEHIWDYPALLENVRKWLFISLPIFSDVHHVLRSKHFRPTEHYWYFTRDGLVRAMGGCGFDLMSESMVETELGREDIGTFAFRRDGCSND
jgi:hypothetical protein